jgi:hypothetical protein
MRKSLSVTFVLTALGLSLLLSVVALADQLGARSLVDHADAVYAPHGKDPSAGLLYGTLHLVAGLGAVLWFLALRSLWAGGRWARALVVTAAVVAVLLALVLLTSREYDEQIWPLRWGVLALLPALAGLPAVAVRAPRGVSATPAAPRTTASSTGRTS